MRNRILCLLLGSLAAFSALAAGQTCPNDSTTATPGDPCPGASSSQCVLSKCPAGALTVGPRRPRRFNISAIQAAINATPAGVPTTICVRPATYVGHTLNFGGKPIDLVGLPGATLLGTGNTVVSFITNEGSGSVLDGFTITGGTGTGGVGGGIYINNASPTIKNCQISGNAANVTTNNSHPRGGGMYVSGNEASPTITCDTFANNTSQYEAGGLESAYDARPFMDYVTFENNAAPYGAGFASDFNGSADIENSLFMGNAASVDGGGIHVLTQFGHTFVRRSVFFENSAGSNGGAAWVPAGFATFLNSSFYNNSGVNGAAVSAGFGGTVLVESSVLESNNAGANGVLAVTAGDLTDGTSLLNMYNCFGNNSSTNSFNTINTNVACGPGNSIDVPEQYVGCFCLPATSAFIGKGMPDLFFNNTYNGSRNDCGAHGGPTAN